ncbi:hypothetical protein GCM10025331_35390 [Actinoplanes utahensis]|nr:hypothetical protein Aut01nite_50930 [Actinoplanes utahensis]
MRQPSGAATVRRSDRPLRRRPAQRPSAAATSGAATSGAATVRRGKENSVSQQGTEVSATRRDQDHAVRHKGEPRAPAPLKTTRTGINRHDGGR